MKKRILVIAVTLGLLVVFSRGTGLIPGARVEPNPSASVQETREDAGPKRIGDEALAETYRNRESNVIVEGQGIVAKILKDDTDGSRHQRFIVRLGSGQTLLIAHNIDLAERVASLKAGDRVQFRGEYEWNEAGGVIHWTHADPGGHHPDGYIKHDGETYQ